MAKRKQVQLPLNERRSISIRMTIGRALELGLIRCGSCGWPPNNHFHFDEQKCAHESKCSGFRLDSVRGTTLGRAA